MLRIGPGCCVQGIVLRGPEQPLRAQRGGLAATKDIKDMTSVDTNTSLGLGMATRDFRLDMGFLVLDHCPDCWRVISLLLSSHIRVSHTRHILPSMFALGVRASERLAEIDMPYLLRYQPVIRTVGQKYCVDPAVIAGVLSRESHGGNVMANVGNMGDGIGVVQVTLHQLWHMAQH